MDNKGIIIGASAGVGGPGKRKIDKNLILGKMGYIKLALPKQSDEDITALLGSDHHPQVDNTCRSSAGIMTLSAVEDGFRPPKAAGDDSQNVDVPETAHQISSGTPLFLSPNLVACSIWEFDFTGLSSLVDVRISSVRSSTKKIKKKNLRSPPLFFSPFLTWR